MTVRLLAVPIAGRNTASSRLRLYDLVAGLPEKFHTDVVRPRDEADLRGRDLTDYDVVYVQKDAGPAVLELCRSAKAAGLPVVYDIDDDFGVWPNMAEAELCALADTVLVDSPGRADSVRPFARRAPVVLPCMIDLAGDPTRPGLRPPRETIATVASFGNLVSLHHTMPYLASVPPFADTYVIGPADAAEHLPGVRLLLFDLASFIIDLLPADVFVLAHGEQEAPLKDNNRLILAMSLGMPFVVSPTPAYVEVLDELGLSWLACAPNEVDERLHKLADPLVRAEIGRVGYEYAWANYSPPRCAELLTAVLADVVSAHR